MLQPLKPRNQYAIALVLIGLAIFIAYFGVWNNSFSYDDYSLILNSPSLGGPVFSKVHLFMDSGYSTSGRNPIRVYRPIEVVLFSLLHHLFGNSSTHLHVVSLLLHGLCGFLVFLLALSLFRKFSIALLGAIFFVLWPVNSQQVNQIAFCAHILEGILFLAASLAFLSWQKTGKKQAIIIFCLATALSILTKESSLIIPAALPFLMLASGKIDFRRLGIAMVTAFLIAAGYIVFRLWILGIPFHQIPAVADESAFLRTLYVYPYLLGLMFSATPLSVFHPFNIPNSFFHPMILCGTITILLSLTTFCIAWKKDKTIAGCLGIFAITLTPYSGIPRLPFPIADHYLYIPVMAIAVIFASLLLSMIYDKRKLFSVGASAIAIFFILFSLAQLHQRNPQWKNNEILWASAADIYPNHPLPWYNIAVAKQEKGDDKAAIKFYLIAHSKDPNHLLTLINIGDYNFRHKDFAKAEKYFLLAQKKDEENIIVLFNLGVVYLARGEKNKAGEFFEKVVVLDPGHALAVKYLALCKENSN